MTTKAEKLKIRQETAKEILDVINKDYYARDPETREVIIGQVSFKKKLAAAEKHGTAQGAVHNFISSLNKQIKETVGIIEDTELKS